jgi:hypothetical protein
LFIHILSPPARLLTRPGVTHVLRAMEAQSYIPEQLMPIPVCNLVIVICKQYL